MKKFFKILLSVSVIVVAGIFLSGCTPTSTNSSTDNNNSGEETSANTVTIKSMAFTPSTLSVKVGDTVTWKNNDGLTHTVTSDDDVFDSGAMSNGKSFTFTFNEAGTFSYHCEFHQTMRAKIVVSE